MGTKVLLLGLLITVICLAPSPTAAQSRLTRLKDQAANDAIDEQQKSFLLSDLVRDKSLRPSPANFAKAKSDAAKLAALAKELREELNKPNVDVLSPEVVNRAKQIAKLAKRIGEETRPD